MNPKPIVILPDQLSLFISTNTTCVVHATIDSATEFNSTLYSRLKQYLKLPHSIGTVTTESLDYNDIYLRKLLGEQMTSIGLEASDTLLPGYYLFKNGILAAFHPGTFDVSKLDKHTTNTAMWIGVFAGLVTALASKSFVSGLMTFMAISEVPTGMNIFEFFKEVLENKSEVDMIKRQQVIFETEVDKAYALLGVSKLATDAEVKKAYRRLLLECHPDKNPENVEKSNRLTIQVKEAYELIFSSRKTVENKFSYA